MAKAGRVCALWAAITVLVAAEISRVCATDDNPPDTVAATLAVGNAILTEAALSYLGLGIQPPAPSWGNMLFNAQVAIFDAPWIALFPGVMIMLTVLAINLIGEGIRDAVDPRALVRSR